MAQVFSPDIGMDIGASNVTVKSGVSLDLSSVSKAFGSVFEKKTVSEADVKRAAFAPLAQGLQRIKEDPNLSPAQSKIKTALFVSSWADANPQYSSEAKSVLGLQDEVAKDLVTPLQQTISDWGSSEGNKDMAAGFSLAATKEDGTRDEEKYNQLVLEAIQVNARKDTLTNVAAATKAERTNIWENDPKKGYTAMADLIAINAEQVLSGEMVAKGLIVAGQSTTSIDPTKIKDQFVIPTINILEDQKRKAGEDLDKLAISLKQDISTPEYKAKRELALAPFSDKIDFLKTNQDNFAAYSTQFKAVRDQLVAQQEVSGIEADKVLTRAAIEGFGPQLGPAIVGSKEGKQVLMNALISSNQEDINKVAVNLKNMANGSENIGTTIYKGLTPTSSVSSYMQMYVPQTTIGPDGGPAIRTAATLSPDAVKTYTDMPTPQKADVVKSGIAIMANIDTVTSPNIPYAMDVVGNTLNLSLMTDQPKLDSGQVKGLYTPGFFNFGNKIKGQVDPAIIQGYNEKADASVQLQLSRDWADVSSQLKVVEKAMGGGKIFSIAVVDGKYVPTFAKNFDQNNPNVRKKMLEEGITTPQELIKSYTRRPWFGGDMLDETKLNSSLDSINYVSSSLIKLPAEDVANFKVSYSYSKEQMSVFNSDAGVTPFEANVAVSKVKQDIPANHSDDPTKLQFFHYFSIDDEMKRLMNTPASPERSDALSNLAIQKDKALEQLPGKGTDLGAKMRQLYDAEQTASVAGNTSNATRKFKWSELVGIPVAPNTAPLSSLSPMGTEGN